MKKNDKTALAFKQLVMLFKEYWKDGVEVV